MAKMLRQAELTTKPLDVSVSHVPDSRFPVTNYCMANSGQRSWHPPLKSNTS